MGSCQSRIATIKGVSTPSAQERATVSHNNCHEPSPVGHDDDKAASTTQHSTSSSQRGRVGLDALWAERQEKGHLTENVVHLEWGNKVPIETVYQGVHDGTELGEGVAGVVRKVQHVATGLPYAVKVLTLQRLSLTTTLPHQQPQQQQPQDPPMNASAVATAAAASAAAADAQMEALRNEITIMSQLDHPHIARLQEVYQDEEHIYLVQEICTGGDLFEWLYDQPYERLDEPTARRIIWQILSAVRYLHAKGIVHRDLKLENFLFCTRRHDQVKMIDFGLSKHFVYPGEILQEKVGTPYTVAPEVLRGSYDEKCDLWGVGVLAYLLLSGDAPFGMGESVSAMISLRDNIMAGRFEFDLPNRDVWATVSEQAKDFIQSLLVTNPVQRPNAAQAQAHAWMVSYQKQQMTPSLVSPLIVQALASFKELPITKRLMFEVFSFTLMQEQIAHIQEEFEKLDQDGLGELSLQNMRQLQLIEAMLPSDDNHQSQQNHRCRLRHLSEAELERIFERIKVGKSEPRVHWHEFVAACLSTCHIHDGNVRIAFDRLDQDHDGYITYDGVLQMIARDADEDEDALRRAWQDSVHEFQCQQSHFTLEDFSRLVHSYV